MSGVRGQWKAGWASTAGGSTTARILVLMCCSRISPAAQSLPLAPTGTPGSCSGAGGPRSVGAGMKSDIVPPNKVNFLISP